MIGHCYHVGMTNSPERLHSFLQSDNTPATHEPMTLRAGSLIPRDSNILSSMTSETDFEPGRECVSIDALSEFEDVVSHLESRISGCMAQFCRVRNEHEFSVVMNANAVVDEIGDGLQELVVQNEHVYKYTILGFKTFSTQLQKCQYLGRLYKALVKTVALKLEKKNTQLSSGCNTIMDEICLDDGPSEEGRKQCNWKWPLMWDVEEMEKRIKYTCSRSLSIVNEIDFQVDRGFPCRYEQSMRSVETAGSSEMSSGSENAERFEKGGRFSKVGRFLYSVKKALLSFKNS